MLALGKMKFNVINIIMFIRLSVGLYSKVLSSSVFTVVSKCYCYMLAVTAIYKVTIFWGFLVETKLLIFELYNIVIYISSIFVLIISDGEHFYEYLKKLKNADPLALVKVQERLLTSCVVTIVCICLNIYRLFLLLYWHRSLFILNEILLHTLTSSGFFLNYVSRIIIFELLWTHLRALRQTIVRSLRVPHDASEDQIQHQIKKMEEYLLIHKRILSALNITGHAPKFMTIISLPSIFLRVLTHVADIFTNKSRVIDSLYIIDTAVPLLLPLIPAVLAELSIAEVDKIKVYFTSTLFLNPNESVRRKTLDAITYLEHRRLKYTVWRIFSLDVSLLLAIFSVSTTYTIIMIQFLREYT